MVFDLNLIRHLETMCSHLYSYIYSHLGPTN